MKKHSDFLHKLRAECPTMENENRELTEQELDAINAAQGLTFAESEELDAMLEDMRSRDDEIPQWDFFDGFMAALICCRRRIEPREYFEVLLNIPDIESEVNPADADKIFADEAQKQRFLQLWHQRRAKAVLALDAKVSNFDDPACYVPQVQDLRGMVALLPKEEQAEFDDALLPSYGQDWAYGFMLAVEAWPEDWTPPRDKVHAKMLDKGLDAIVALTEDDREPRQLADDAPAGASETRLDEFDAAVMALYSLRALGRVLRAQTGPVQRAPTLGRNDPCYCGSGKKFKKCHGA